MSSTDDLGKQLVSTITQLQLLFEKYEIKKGDWFGLALHLAIEHGEIHPYEKQAKRGRAKYTSIHHARDWLKIQRRIDDNHTKANACRLANIKPSRYYRVIQKDPLVKALERIREELGSNKFWSAVKQEDLNKAASGIDELPRALRLLLSDGDPSTRGAEPTLLTGKDAKK